VTSRALGEADPAVAVIAALKPYTDGPEGEGQDRWSRRSIRRGGHVLREPMQSSASKCAPVISSFGFYHSWHKPDSSERNHEIMNVEF